MARNRVGPSDVPPGLQSSPKPAGAIIDVNATAGLD
jgi:hypothetical protein